MEKFLYIALFAPLVGSLFASLFGAKKKTLITGVATSTLLAISLICSLILLNYVSYGEVVSVEMMDWIMAGDFSVSFGFVVDQVSAIMMVVVTSVSTLVHIYSIGYMDHDKGFNRYFSYLSAFVFSMMILVMSDNFLGLFIGWEGVGLCSWLLIGFWYHKHSAGWAANEAFIMNRIADLGMLIGIFLLYWNTGSLKYSDVFADISMLDHSLLVMIGIFLFIGAMGKSAQFPLHTWLADAMEGPTPVSALIHAATMVTAGVYLVIRSSELYTLIPEVGAFIASLGAFVALFAGTMALVNNDLKRIVAYSTLSQLGYMFVAAGLGAYWVALFHLMTHAFFKSMLFLGAGNVMHAMHDELNIKKMGGLFKVMKVTAILMIIASIALAGIFPFAGFFSKDKILEVAFGEHAYIIWFVLWVTAGLTAFYSFRLIMLVFFGRENYKDFGIHPHEAYKFMLVAMSPLAILSICSGWFKNSFVKVVEYMLPSYQLHLEHSTELVLIGITTVVALGGIFFAIYAYKKGIFKPSLEESAIYKLLKNQYYIPKLYDMVFIKPFIALSTIAWKEIDLKIVDATVDAIANTIYSGSEKAKCVQSGNLSKMLKLMVIGLLLFMIIAIFLATQS